MIRWCFETARPRSTGEGPVWLRDFVPALEQFLGGSAGLSPATVTRLTQQWSDVGGGASRARCGPRVGVTRRRRLDAHRRKAQRQRDRAGPRTWTGSNLPATRANTDSDSAVQPATSVIPCIAGQRQAPAQDTIRCGSTRRAAGPVLPERPRPCGSRALSAGR
ncbi:hypothetical protein C3488_22140 [Streptomyces sp. Ru72]|nr:hypothetical protein C3488_22140 [Streptomyces sp. Ru72]